MDRAVESITVDESVSSLPEAALEKLSKLKQELTPEEEQFVHVESEPAILATKPLELPRKPTSQQDLAAVESEAADLIWKTAEASRLQRKIKERVAEARQKQGVNQYLQEKLEGAPLSQRESAIIWLGDELTKSKQVLEETLIALQETQKALDDQIEYGNLLAEENGKLTEQVKELSEQLVNAYQNGQLTGQERDVLVSHGYPGF